MQRKTSSSLSLTTWVVVLLAITSPLSGQTAFQSVEQITAHLDCKNQGLSTQGAATVLSLKPSGARKVATLMTSAHLVDSFRPDDCFLTYRGMTQASRVLEFVSNQVDTNLDLAVITAEISDESATAIQATKFRVLSLFQPSRGVKVFMIGHPTGQKWFVPQKPEPIISTVGDILRIQYDGVKEGFSGGSLLCDDGAICGFISSKISNNIIEAKNIKSVLNRIVSWEVDLAWKSLTPRATTSTELSRPIIIRTAATTFFDLGELAASIDHSDDGDLFDDMDGALGKAILVRDLRVRIEELKKERKISQGKAARSEKTFYKKSHEDRIRNLISLQAKTIAELRKELKEDKELENFDLEEFIRFADLFITSMLEMLMASLSDESLRPSLEVMSIYLDREEIELRKFLELDEKVDRKQKLTQENMRKAILRFGSDFAKEAFSAGEIYGRWYAFGHLRCPFSKITDLLSSFSAKGIEIDDFDSATQAKFAVFRRVAGSNQQAPILVERSLISLLTRYKIEEMPPYVSGDACKGVWTREMERNAAALRGKLQAALENRVLP
jgi:hypothetical protein